MRFGPVVPETLTLTHIILYGVPKNVQELKLSITKGPEQTSVFALKVVAHTFLLHWPTLHNAEKSKGPVKSQEEKEGK